MTVTTLRPLFRRKKSASLFLALMMLIAGLLLLPPAVNAGSRVSHGAIAISGDSGFTAANGVTGGTGAASDPYVISGWSIEYQFVPAQISVSNTRAYFVVRNVTTYGATNAIVLSNVTNARLENLESSGGAVPGNSVGIGILVTSSNWVTITGVLVYSSGTTHEGGGGPGIIIRSSSNVLVTNNNIPGNYGTDLSVDSSSTNVTITGNSIGGTQTGLGMDLSGVNVTVSQNAFHNSGLVFSGSVKIASDNTVNGKPLYYYHDCNNLSLSNVPVGMLIIKNCSNVQLSNLSISITDFGIDMYSVHRVLIQNVSSTSNNYANIRISGSTDVTIEHSDFSNVPLNYFDGPGAWNAVNISGSNNTIIDGNVIINGQRAIALSSDLNATVSGNTLAHSNGMLCLYGSTSVHIYHNNFLKDPDYTWFCLSDTQPGHFWDNGLPSGGNYWSNYTGSDPDNDVIGDTPQPIPGGVYQDRYPLMNPYPASIPLTIEYNWSPFNQMVGQPVTFKASAVGGIAPYSFSWNFGDGSTGSGTLVTHAFASRPPPGSWTVKLTVTDSASPIPTSYSVVHYVFVTAPPPQLAASFTSTSQNGQSSTVQLGQWMRFDATASGGTSPYSYSWNFGDGTSSTGLEVFHTYTSVGTFTVRLTVNDTGAPQQTATAQKAVTVTNPPPVLTASFVYSPFSPQTGQAITFTGTIGGGTPSYSSYWTFGDGSPAVTGSSATHTFNAPGSYLVTFYGSDSGSQTAFSQQTVTVTSQSSPLVIAESASPPSGLVGQAVTFTLTASGGVPPYSFSWSLGDGTRGTGPTASHIYSAPGSYYIRFNVTDSASPSNFAYTAGYYTVQNPTPVIASFTYSPLSPVPYQAVTFTASASGGTPPYSFGWNFGDTSSGSGQTITHIYLAPGKYNVTLGVTDSVASDAPFVTHQTITVNNQPTSSNYILSWQGYDWDGGHEETIHLNGQIVASLPATSVSSNGGAWASFSLNITSFVAKGTNTLTFTHAGWDCGTSDNVRNLQVISGNAIVYANSTIEPLSCTQNLTYLFNPNPTPTPLSAGFTFSPPPPSTYFTFTAQASGGFQPYAYAWDFGDGHTCACGLQVLHNYQAAGTYTVTLTVTDSASPNPQTTTVTHTVTVPPPAPPPLSAGFSFTPSNPTTGQTITFNGTASGGVSPYSYSWSFGDGSSGSGATATHAYSTAGTYTVTLTVTDSASPIDTTEVTQSVVVSSPQPPPLSASFSYTPASPIVGQTITFTATVSGGVPPYAFRWNFGDSTTGSVNPVTHAYSAQGTYTVNLTVIDTASPTPNTLTVTKSVTVSPPPPPPPLQASITYSPTNPVAGQIVTFSANATGGVSPYSYSWNFGDTSTSIGQFTSHSYSSQGTYAVTVTVSDSESPAKTFTSTRSVVVSAPPPLTISFSYTPSHPTAGSPVTFTSSETGGVPPYSLSWNFGDGTTGLSGSAGHNYTSPGTYTVVFSVNDSASPHNSQTTSQVITVSAAPSSSPYNLSWQGYDWDGGGEETVTLNGHFVARLPAANSPQNGGAWASFSLNITSFVVKGTNTLTFTHAGWDCSTSDNVRNLQVTSGTTVIFSDPNIHPLSCTQTLTYTFTV